MSETFVAKRSEWERGTGDGFLYNMQKKCGCILGLYLIAHGADPETLDGHQRPERYLEENGGIETPIELIVDNEAYDDDDVETEEYRYRDTPWTNRAIALNDDAGAEAQRREHALSEHFAAQGCELKFVD